MSYQENDEFYFVPTGEKAPKAVEIEEVPVETDNVSETDKDELKKKSKRKGNRSVPVVYATRGSSMVYLPSKFSIRTNCLTFIVSPRLFYSKFKVPIFTRLDNSRFINLYSVLNSRNRVRKFSSFSIKTISFYL